MKKPSLYSLLLYLTFIIPQVEAQQKNEVTVKFKTILFEPRDKAAPVLFTGSIGKRTKVSLGATRISDFQKASVRDGNKVDFYEAENAEKPIATVTIHSKDKPLLFVFAPFRREMRAWAIEVPETKFGKGSTMMINATMGSIAIKQADEKAVAVASGKSKILSVPAGFKNQMLPILIYERKKTEKEWVIAQSTRWPVDRRFRSYVFVYRKTGSKHLLMHGVPERLVAPPE